MAAPKARLVLIIFMKKAHPDLIVDYRMLDPMMSERRQAPGTKAALF